jgi:hypothetical protein
LLLLCRQQTLVDGESEAEDQAEPDQVVEENPEGFLHVWMDVFDLHPELVMNLPTIAFLLLSFGLAGIGIAGAVTYNAWLVMIAALSLMVDIGYGIVTVNQTMIIVGLFWLYPHVVLIKEIGTGIMTPDTYPKEERVCLSSCGV